MIRGMFKLMFLGARLLFLPFELLIRLAARRSDSNSIGRAVARHQPPLMTYSTEPRVIVMPSLHVPVPPRDYGIDVPLPPPPGA